MMIEKSDRSRVSRRQFLKDSAAVGTAAAAVAMTGNAVATEEETPAAESKKKGYQRTAHVEAYYKSARG